MLIHFCLLFSYYVLYSLQNAFNMENFSELKEVALLCLMKAYPAVVLPVVADRVTSDSASVVERTSVLALLALAAEALAGLGTTPSPPEPEPAHASISKQAGKTKVKRPIKLKLLGESKVYFRNGIVEFMNFLFNPARDVLGTSISSKLNQIKFESKGQCVFLLYISELAVWREKVC